MTRHAPHTFAEYLLSVFPPPHYLTMQAAGVDISPRDVRYIEFSDTKHGRVISTYGEAAIPLGVLERGEVHDLDQLTKALARIREREGFTFVRASLPEQRSYIFRTTVPDARDREEVNTILEFQLEEHVPIAPGDAVFDFSASAVHRAAEHTDISVTVFPREVIEKYVAAFSRAGMTPISFEIEPQAITRAVVPEGDEKTHLVVNIGRFRIGIFVVVKGVVSFTSSIDIGGAQLFTQTANGETRPSEDAIARLAEEIERHQGYWDSRTDLENEATSNIEGVILCGSFAAIPEIVGGIGGRLSVPVTRANVWANAVSFEDTIPPIHRDDALDYATAIGLALREGGE